MKVQDLISEVEEFRAALVAHRDLYGKSLDNELPDYPVVNVKQLEEQSRLLNRMVGRLRPFLERLRSTWHMRQYGGGPSVDALDAATSTAYVAQLKGDALDLVIGAIDQVLGQLQALQPDDEIPSDLEVPPGTKSGAPTDRVILGYLDHLHPHIGKGCAQLFRDGYYAKAVEEGAKAVSDYLRQKTGLKLDGVTLAEHSFSEKNPVLKFGDLSDTNVRDEQIGFMHLLKGLAQGVRNPLAHTHGKEEQEQKAFEYLVMVSLFCRRIDDATKP
jgi:uncharacterized protein (TIGR02391 family)